MNVEEMRKRIRANDEAMASNDKRLDALEQQIAVLQIALETLSGKTAKQKAPKTFDGPELSTKGE